MGDFVDGKMFLRSLSRKKAVFLDETLFSRSASKKMGVFLDETLFSRSVAKKKAVFLEGKVFRGRWPRKWAFFWPARWQTKKETPPKGCLSKVLRFTRLLIKRSSHVNSASNCATYHRVVTDAEESHHLNVCWN